MPGGRSASRKVAEGRTGREGPDPAPTSQSRSPHGPSPTPPRRPDSGPCSHSAPTAACSSLPRAGSPGVTSVRGPVAPSLVLSRGAAAPGGRWTRVGMLRHGAGGPRPRRAAPEQCACPSGPQPGRRRYQAGIGRNPSAPATSAGHSLRRGSTAGGRAAGGGHPVLSQAVPASRGSGSPQTFCVSGREGPAAASGICTHPTCRVPWEAGVQFRSGGCPCAVQLGFEPRVWISPEAPTLPQHLRCGLRKSCPQGTGQGQASCHRLTRWEGQP